MKTKTDYARVPAGFDLSEAAEKAVAAVSSMGYEVKTVPDGSSITVTASKDVGGMDTFLGRWKRFSLTAELKSGGGLLVRIHSRSKIDKILCVIIGACTFAIPWILALISRGNRFEAEAVAMKAVSDYIDKKRNEEDE